MTTSDTYRSCRRAFLKRAACVVSYFGIASEAKAAPTPEVKRIRLAYPPVACTAPLYIAKDLLLADGFSEIEYVAGLPLTGPAMVAAGLAEFTHWDVGAILPLADHGESPVVLAGTHAGCQEMIANESVRSIRDLKGKRIAISSMLNGDHVFVSSILGYVGIDPRREVTWVTDAFGADARKLFVEGKVDAFMAFEPEPRYLRQKGIGHSILKTTEDKPWSQYYCCMLSGNRNFVRKNPIATKRVLRAVLKAADICAQQPERVARYMVDKGYETQYEVSLEVLRSLPFQRWREANPEDTLRFHALRLHEVGMIKTPPNELIARGTDWRFLNALKQELKS